jgi:hypothetical protein
MTTGDLATGVIASFIIGFACGGVSCAKLSEDMYDEREAHRALITECELPLPRTEHCILTAIPEETAQ